MAQTIQPTLRPALPRNSCACHRAQCSPLAVVAAGCGAVGRVTSGNPASGKALFIKNCGACHTLANAGTTGTVGPNLDNAFLPDKQQGFHISTITDVVRGQIAYPPNTDSRAPATPGHDAEPRRTARTRRTSRSTSRMCAGDPTCDVPPRRSPSSG